MGNENSRTALSSSKISRLRSQIKQEYPWLLGVEESMLVTDMRQPDCPIVYANNDFYKMTQYDKEEVLGLNCRFLQGKHTNPKTVNRIRESIKNGQELEVEILNYRKDGTPFINQFLIVPLHAKKTQPDTVTHYIAVQKDVTFLIEQTNPEKWHPAQVSMWLETAGYGEFIGPFINYEITGEQLLQLSKDKLQQIGICDISLQVKILSLVDSLVNDGPTICEDITISPFSSNELLSGLRSASLERTTEKRVLEADISPKRSQCLLSATSSAYARRQSNNSATERILVEQNNDNKEDTCVDVSFSCTLDNSTKLVTVTSDSLLFHLKRAIVSQFRLTEYRMKLSVVQSGSFIPLTPQYYKFLLSQTNCEQNEIYVEQAGKESNDILERRKNSVVFESSADLLKVKTKQDEIEFIISLLISREDPYARAILFDSLINKKNSHCLLHSVESIWKDVLDMETGACFCIPAASNGTLFLPHVNFMHQQRCEQILEEKMSENMGEIPLGNTVLLKQGGSFILLVVVARTNVLKHVASKESYYKIFRNILVRIHSYNRSIQDNRPQCLESLTLSTEQSAITNLLFPFYLSENENGAKRGCESQKFAHQVKLALKSFTRCKMYAIKNQSSNEPKRKYRKCISLIDRELRQNPIKQNESEKHEKFLSQLSMGCTSTRGLLDTDEIDWLTELVACTNSQGMSQRRLQYLAQISLISLLSEKRFKTGKKFQQQLRASIVRHTACFEWLLDMASSGFVQLCRQTTLDTVSNMKRFATGGTAVVYRGTWEDNETVAVKRFLLNEEKKIILREVALMTMLDHCNILPVYAFGTADSQLFSISPYAEKGSLYHVIQNREEEFNFASRIHILTQIAIGLEYIHDLNLIHRDLKSLNILVGRNYHVYVADVGITRIQNSIMTKNMGTTAWMAPEIFTSENYTQKADIYSFGMIVYEVITNKTPFEDWKSFAIPDAVIKGNRPTLPSNLRKQWTKFVQSLWHHKPSKRPTIREAIDVLHSIRNVSFFE